MGRGLVLLLVTALGLALTGCSTSRQPDLAWLYGAAGQGGDTNPPPLVLVPGLMGTRLLDPSTGREAWPGSLLRIVFDDYAHLALAAGEEPSLVPGGLTDRVAGRDFYASIVSVLEDAGGYRRARPGEEPPAGRVYYVFGYDWRRDLQRTAANLQDFLDVIRADHGDPELRFDFLAHSMGGLAVRYFLRFGREDALEDNRLAPNLEGASYARRVLLLGTPNLGSVDSIRALIEGKRLGARRIPPETLATMPSMFQLFPHALVDWIVTAEGRPLDRDQFDVELWRRFEWGVFDPAIRERIRRRHDDGIGAEAALRRVEAAFEARLERARRFVWALTVEVETPVPLVVFGGDCRRTPARIVVEEIEGTSFVRLWPREILRPVVGIDYDRLMLDPGDGAVTKASLLARTSIDPTVPRHRYTDFPLSYSFLLCAPHDGLARNRSFQDNLLDALLRPDALPVLSHHLPRQGAAS